MEITVSELRSATKKWVDAAAAGEDVVVKIDGTPSVRLTAVGSSDLLARLKRDGLIEPPAGERAVPRLPQAEAAKDALSSLMGRLRR